MGTDSNITIFAATLLLCGSAVNVQAQKHEGNQPLTLGPSGLAGGGAGAGSASICDVHETSRVLRPEQIEGSTFNPSVATAGDFSIVGLPKASNAGAAYVANRAGSAWSAVQILHGVSEPPHFSFGQSVAMDATWAVIGAPDTGQFPSGPGAAYVFFFNGTAWTQFATLLASDGDSGDQFGFSVAISGGTIMVGAPNDEEVALGAGSVYVFRFDGSTWNQVQKLQASDAGSLKRFGYSVSLSGAQAAIGSPRTNGGAYIFGYDGAQWIERQKIAPPLGPPANLFGRLVSLSGNGLAVAAPIDYGNGWVFAYEFDGFTWGQEQQIVAPSASGASRFGLSISLHNDVLAVGAPSESVTVTFDPENVGEEAGCVYVYRRVGGQWLLSHRLDAEFRPLILAWNYNYNQFDHLGTAVCVSETAIAAVVPDDFDFASGSVLLFEANPADCDLNAVPDNCDPDCNVDAVNDTCSITAGTSWDCDHSGVPDECEAEYRYVLEDGIGSLGWGLVNGGDYIWLNRYKVRRGAQFITHIAVPWLSVMPEGTPVTLLLYRDPNNDGDPHDAILLRTAQGGTHAVNGIYANLFFTIYPIQRTYVGKAERFFFVGAKVSHSPGQFPAVSKYIVLSPPRSWRTWSPLGQGNIVHLAENQTPLAVMENNRWALRAMSLDCNGNDMTDSCDIADGFSQDINQNGIPDECDNHCAADVALPLDARVDRDDLLVVITHFGTTGPPGNIPGDAISDGIVDNHDLQKVLNAWGNCP